MKILVTGGGGFLGGNIVEGLLARGHEVRSIGRSPQPENAERGVEVIQGDLAKRDDVLKATDDCEAVFHVAAKAGVWGPHQEYWDANVTGTRNVIAACQENGVRFLVHTSTPSVVYNGQAISGGDESLPYGTDIPCTYPTTKVIAEKEALAANSPLLAVCVLRPHLIWGKGDPHIVPRLVQRARQGRLRPIGDGTNRVDITHVKNAAQAHLIALDSLQAGTANGKAYFISDGQPVVLWDWIADLLKRLGEPDLKKPIAAKTAYRMGALLEKIWSMFKLPGEPPMTRFVATELSKDHWFDISAARRDLGYEPVVENENGLAELAATEPGPGAPASGY